LDLREIGVIMNEIIKGFEEGARIAKISVLTLVSIGIAEIIVGFLSGSIVAFADGVDAFGDASISFIVWLGLLTSQRRPDARFQFGYYKIESLAAFMAAIGMGVMGTLIIFRAWESLLNPGPIDHPYIVMATLASAALVSLYRAMRMNNIAKKYNLLSLQTDARNSIKDTSASTVAFFSVLVAIYTGFLQMDSIGAMVIAAFIFSVAYVAIRESSFVLLDVCKNPRLSSQIETFIENTYKVNVSNVLLRPVGPFLHGEINVVVKGVMTVEEFDRIADTIEHAVKSRFPMIKRLAVTVEPEEAAK
jgi:cation diffusion facilitator family transporter